MSDRYTEAAKEIAEIFTAPIEDYGTGFLESREMRRQRDAMIKMSLVEPILRKSFPPASDEIAKLIEEIHRISDTGILPDGDHPNCSTLMWFEVWSEKLRGMKGAE